MSFVEVLPIELSYIIFDYTDGYNIFCKCVCKKWCDTLVNVKYDEQFITACWIAHDDPKIYSVNKRRFYLSKKYETSHANVLMTAISTGRFSVLYHLLETYAIVMSDNLLILTAKCAVKHHAHELAMMVFKRLGMFQQRTEVIKMAFTTENNDFIRYFMKEWSDASNDYIIAAVDDMKSLEWLHEISPSFIDANFNGLMVKAGNQERWDTVSWLWKVRQN